MINSVVLVGRLTKDIEIRKTTSGKSVASYTLAVQRDKEHADFINCVAWNKLAENMSLYCHKGDMVAVEGRINTRSYDNQYGSKTFITEVVADNVQFLESKKAIEPQNNQGHINTYESQQSSMEQSYGAYNAIEQTYGNTPREQLERKQMSLTQEAEKNAYSEALDIQNDDLPF